jgi:hypothetical protein
MSEYDDENTLGAGCGFFGYAATTWALWYWVSWYAGAAFLILAPIVFAASVISLWKTKDRLECEQQLEEARELVKLIDNRELNWVMRSDDIVLYSKELEVLVKIKNVFYGQQTKEKLTISCGRILQEYNTKHVVWRKSKELATYLYNEGFFSVMEMAKTRADVKDMNSKEYDNMRPLHILRGK